MQHLDYPFKTVPYQHQLDAFHKGRDREAFALLAEMGTGKSKMLIDNIAYLYDRGAITGVLIIAPKGVYRNWVNNELPTHMPDHVRYRVGAWAADARKSDVAAMQHLAARTEDLKILVINVEALSTKRGIEYAKDFLCSVTALVAIDESTSIKNPTSMRTKAVTRLGKYAKYRRIMSGEPAANSPLNLYAQFGFLDPHLLGFGSFFSFKAHFGILQDMNMGGGRSFKTVVGYRNLDELHRIIAPHSFIVKKKDCLDLPEKIYTTRSVDMSPKQRKAYEEMRQNALVELADLEKQGKLGAGSSNPPGIDVGTQLSFEEWVLLRASGTEVSGQMTDNGVTVTAIQGDSTVTANIVITQLLRLHQIACGFMQTDDGKTIRFDDGNPRIDALLDTLEECDGKVIIWATYKDSIVEIKEAVAKKFGPESIVTYYGPTSRDDRDYAVKAFQDPNSPVRFFVSNSTGSRGLTLTQATTCIYFANSYDLEVRGQSEDRAHRISQRSNVVYIDFVAEDTVDEKILKVLKTKKKLSDVVTKSNWRQML